MPTPPQVLSARIKNAALLRRFLLQFNQASAFGTLFLDGVSSEWLAHHPESSQTHRREIGRIHVISLRPL
jgi:hypothetical protein